MNALFSLLGAVLSVPLALSNPVSSETQISNIETIDEAIAIEETVTPLQEEGAQIVFAPATEVVQEIPDYSTPWLDGRVSLIGGEITTSERQFLYAESNRLPFVSSESEYRQLSRNGFFVRLGHSDITVPARRPYVLPSTAEFVYATATAYRAAGCGRLAVTGAGRLTTERPVNGSLHSVHPTGMAVDIRVRGVSSVCEEWLNAHFTTAEANGVIDATREHLPPHFHVVVVPQAVSIDSDRNYLSANN